MSGRACLNLQSQCIGRRMRDTIPDAPQRRLQVFLCHSSNDKDRVRELYDSLANAGFAPWLDEKALVGGQDWEFEITQAVKNSDVVLVCLSNTSINRRGYVQKEIKYALDVAQEQPEGTIFIIPVLLEDCDVPARLKSYHWVSLNRPSGAENLQHALRTRAHQLSRNSGPVQVAQPPDSQGVTALEPPKRPPLQRFVVSLIAIAVASVITFSGYRWVSALDPNRIDRQERAPTDPHRTSETRPSTGPASRPWYGPDDEPLAKGRGGNARCWNNMRQIAQAIQMYSNENKGALPPDVNRIAFFRQDLGASTFVCPVSKESPPHYVMVKLPKPQDTGFTLSHSLSSDTVIMYENPANHGGGMHVVFADGHVEFMGAGWAAEFLRSRGVP
jgi:prepilin-type processing-associated H-X9-DG protein